MINLSKENIIKLDNVNEEGVIKTLNWMANQKQVLLQENAAALNQKRQYERVEFIQKVHMNFYNEACPLDAQIINIAERGAFIQTDKDVPLSTKVSFNIEINEKTIPIAAQVNWVSSKKEHKGIGISFVNMQSNHLQQIEDFIQSRIDRIRNTLLKQLFYDRM